MAERRFISTGSRFEAELGYARAVVQEPWCFVSGVTGYDYATMTVPEDPVAQVEACYATVTRVLGEAGFELQDIVKVTHILADRAILSDIQPVLQRVLAPIRPAATMLVADLMTPAMLYEVEVTALRRGGTG